MKEIELTKGYVTYVDDADYSWLNSVGWCANVHNKRVYAFRATSKNRFITTTYMHRLIMNVTDPKVLVDHKDGNSLNNQRENLRLATSRQNTWNHGKREGLTSKYKGVVKTPKGKFNVVMRINGKVTYVGTYDDEVQAALMHDKIVKENRGEFGRLNFPNN